jgi:isoleucyl-tRNA synthetase
VRRVQVLRKTAGLKPTDDVGMEYKILDDKAGVGLEGAFKNQQGVFLKAMRRGIEEMKESNKEEVVAEEEQDVQGAKFLLRFVKLSL